MAKLFTVGLLFLMIPAAFAELVSSETAFETFKSLQGKWAIQFGGKTLPIDMDYEVGSKGNIVTEHFRKELSVIYRDRKSLVITHCCNAGNEPRLRLTESRRTGLLEFEMFDITNLKSGDAAHVEKVIYTIVDKKKIELEVVWQEGKSQESEKYTLSKI